MVILRFAYDRTEKRVELNSALVGLRWLINNYA
jgi:hypothetical protein